MVNFFALGLFLAGLTTLVSSWDRYRWRTIGIVVTFYIAFTIVKIAGMAADIVDAEGAPVARGELGELVMRVPSIGLTRGLWQDPERYIETYWSMYGDMWRQGDWTFTGKRV